MNAAIALAAVFVVFVVLIVWLIVALVRDYANDHRARPVIRSRNYGQTAGTPPPPTPTEVTVKRLERDVANSEQINETLWAELELRPPADPIVRHLRDRGPASTEALVDVLDLDRIDANRRLLAAEEHELVTGERQGSETVWTFHGIDVAIPNQPLETTT